MSTKSQQVKVTVAITNYNYKQYITEAIASALNQDFKDLEVLVVDDASTDGSQEFLKTSFKDKIDLHINRMNQGHGKSLNWCIENAKGEYILFLDGDDILLPGAISALYAKSESAEVVFGYVDSFIDKTNEKANRHQGINAETKELFAQHTTRRLAQMMSRSNKLMSVAFLRKHKIRSSQHRIMNDALFAYTLAASKPKCTFIQDEIMSIREHPLSMSKPDSTEKIKGVLDVTEELNKEIWKRTPSLYLALSGNNLTYFILRRGPIELSRLCEHKKSLPFSSRLIIVLKCLKNNFDLSYTKFL